MQAFTDEEKDNEHEGHIHVHTHATHGHAHGSTIPSEGINSKELTRHRVIAQLIGYFLSSFFALIFPINGSFGKRNSKKKKMEFNLSIKKSMNL